MKRTGSIKYFLAFIIIFLATRTSFSADLDDLYLPLLDKNQYIYSIEYKTFNMDEEGTSGNASYDKVEAKPDYYKMYNSLRFSPRTSWDVEIGFGKSISSEYKRLSYDLTEVPALNQHYYLDYFQDYKAVLRKRIGSTEIYLDVGSKRQRSKWDMAFLPAAPNYFTHIKSYLDDYKIGAKYLSLAESDNKSFDIIPTKRSFISQGQINVEGEFQLKNGRAKRRSEWYHNVGLFTFDYEQQSGPSFNPKFNLRYGLKENFEVEGGISYTFPNKYNFQYFRLNPTSTTEKVAGTYQYEGQIEIPLKLRYKPRQNLQVEVSSDFKYVNQRLDHWYENTSNIVTKYSPKKLGYYNTKPAFRVTYLKGEGKEDSVNSIDMVDRNQWLFEFEYTSDISNIKKGSTNGTLNLVDPYNLFLHPIEAFVGGTEYALYSSGNTVDKAGCVFPQDYHRSKAGFIYGVRDDINMGFAAGFQTGSSMHHLVLNLSSVGANGIEDERFYQFAPYYFMDFSLDWKSKKKGKISFNLHYVPTYKTKFTSSLQPKEFETNNRYIETALMYSISF